MSQVEFLKRYQFTKQLQQLPFVEAIYLYGSRARGDHRERSDIDVALLCPDARTKDWDQVLQIVENADTLHCIDCVRYDAIVDEAFKSAIDRDKVVVYEK